MIMVQRCHDKEQWDEFILEQEGHPLQLWGWGQVKAAHGWTAERLCVYDDEAIVAAVQVLIRPLPFPFKSFAYVPRGPVGDVAYFQDALDEVALFIKREYKSVVLSVEPDSREINLSSLWRSSVNNVLSRETILLNLQNSESDLLADMAKKTRQYIRKSAADGVEVRRAKSRDDIDVCLDIYKETAHRAGFNLHTDQYYIDVFQQMGDHSPVFIAYYQGNPVAFLWLGVSIGTAYELYGGMTEEGQRLRANYTLKWQAIRKMKEWGIAQYDFGGLVAGGVSLFKQGWSTEPYTFAGAFDRPLSPLYTVWTSLLPKAKKIVQRLRRK
jgi:peptidoglycan pentaglycine glycine transferase (the first glycine)